MTYCSLYLRCSALFQAAVEKKQTPGPARHLPHKKQTCATFVVLDTS